MLQRFPLMYISSYHNGDFRWILRPAYVLYMDCSGLNSNWCYVGGPNTHVNINIPSIRILFDFYHGDFYICRWNPASFSDTLSSPYFLLWRVEITKTFSSVPICCEPFFGITITLVTDHACIWQVWPEQATLNMMTSSNGNIFRVSGPLCGDFIDHRWIPLTKASDVELWCFLSSAPWINGWINIREASDLIRHHAHYDGIVMTLIQMIKTACLQIQKYL